MDADQQPAGPAWRSRLGWAIQVICLIYAAFVVVEDVGQMLWTWPPLAATQGGRLGGRYDDTLPGGRMVTVIKVEPGSPMARAGVAAGDRIRFDQPYQAARRQLAGDQVGLTLVHAQRSVRLQLTAEPARPAAPTWLDWLGKLYELATLTAVLFGAFIIWRSRRNPTIILLGMGLVTYGLITTSPQLLVSATPAYPFFFVLGVLNLAVIPILFYGFAMRFYGDCVAPVSRAGQVAFAAYAALALGANIPSAVAAFYLIDFPLVGNGYRFAGWISYLGYAIAVAYLVVGWRRSAAALQQRYALMLVATSAIILAQALDVLSPQNPSDAIQAAHTIANSLLTGVIASGLFAYSILRHRVFDLGFAVNRTLIYGVVSAILLAAFGLIEWAVDHFVPIHGRENNALIDAAIAVGVFLTFHRVRDLVERAIEGLFFRRWQKAEARLRRFVREAAFITESGALAQAFARALGEFGEGAQAAVYVEDERAFVLAAGEVPGAPARLDPNLPLVVALRAGLKPIDSHGEDGPDALAAPMVNRNEVMGVVMLGPKPSGLAWRPDETELIGWAAHQVGLDLHALEVERFAALADQLRHENATLRSLIPQRA